MLLFLHGTGAINSLWLPVIRALLDVDYSYSDRFLLDTFTLSLPGHNSQDRDFDLNFTNQLIKDFCQKNYSIQQVLAQKLVLSKNTETVKAIKNPKLIIIGHSIGGVIAWNYTFKNLENVEKLVIVGTPSKFNFLTVWFCHFFIKFLGIQKTAFLRFIARNSSEIRLRVFIENLIFYPQQKGIDSAFKILKNYNLQKEFAKISLDEKKVFSHIKILWVNGSLDLLSPAFLIKKIPELFSKTKYKELLKLSHKNNKNPNLHDLKSEPSFVSKNILEAKQEIFTQEVENQFEVKIYKGRAHSPMDKEMNRFISDLRKFF